MTAYSINASGSQYTIGHLTMLSVEGAIGEGDNNTEMHLLTTHPGNNNGSGENYSANVGFFDNLLIPPTNGTNVTGGHIAGDGASEDELFFLAIPILSLLFLAFIVSRRKDRKPEFR